MRLFFKTYPDCPKATATNIICNILWVTLFGCLFGYNVIPKEGTAMVLGLVGWAAGSFMICAITDQMAKS
ncbi:MAG: hypothetical protein IKZ97_06195 [Butyrivibrio sp.]|nr:hypothetical protein [Butyrivibrio sp.]